MKKKRDNSFLLFFLGLLGLGLYLLPKKQVKSIVKNLDNNKMNDIIDSSEARDEEKIQEEFLSPSEMKQKLFGSSVPIVRNSNNNSNTNSNSNSILVDSMARKNLTNLVIDQGFDLMLAVPFDLAQFNGVNFRFFTEITKINNWVARLSNGIDNYYVVIIDAVVEWRYVEFSSFLEFNIETIPELERNEFVRNYLNSLPDYV